MSKQFVPRIFIVSPNSLVTQDELELEDILDINRHVNGYVVASFDQILDYVQDNGHIHKSRSYWVWLNEELVGVKIGATNGTLQCHFYPPNVGYKAVLVLIKDGPNFVAQEKEPQLTSNSRSDQNVDTDATYCISHGSVDAKTAIESLDELYTLEQLKEFQTKLKVGTAYWCRSGDSLGYFIPGEPYKGTGFAGYTYYAYVDNRIDTAIMLGAYDECDEIDLGPDTDLDDDQVQMGSNFKQRAVRINGSLVMSLCDAASHYTIIKQLVQLAPELQQANLEHGYLENNQFVTYRQVDDWDALNNSVPNPWDFFLHTDQTMD